MVAPSHEGPAALELGIEVKGLTVTKSTGLVSYGDPL